MSNAVENRIDPDGQVTDNQTVYTGNEPRGFSLRDWYGHPQQDNTYNYAQLRRLAEALRTGKPFNE